MRAAGFRGHELWGCVGCDYGGWDVSGSVVRAGEQWDVGGMLDGRWCEGKVEVKRLNCCDLGLGLLHLIQTHG